MLFKKGKKPYEYVFEILHGRSLPSYSTTSPLQWLLKMSDLPQLPLAIQLNTRVFRCWTHDNQLNRWFWNCSFLNTSYDNKPSGLQGPSDYNYHLGLRYVTGLPVGTFSMTQAALSGAYILLTVHRSSGGEFNVVQFCRHISRTTLL